MATTDRDVLLILHRSTDGANWKNNTNWGTDAPIGDWHGVEVNDDGRVVKLILGGNNLRGPIPPELGKLGALQALSLNYNKLSGQIPPQLGDLRAMVTLNLYNNKLEGPIPPELGILAALTHLSLGRNQLSGPIPPELGKLAVLVHLRLFDNQLSGPIPKELGALTKLEGLWLFNNALSGPIPPELGNLKALSDLYLYDNTLSGGPEANQSLSAWRTRLQGELAEQERAKQIRALENARLEQIPSTMATTDRDVLLILHRSTDGANWKNNTNWGTDAPIGDWHGVEVNDDGRVVKLILGGNNLRGPIPSELGKLGALTHLKLQWNKLSGPIPPELGDLQELRVLWLNNNQLIGPIPKELGALRRLEKLLLYNNNLTGPIPSELGKLGALQELFLRGNKLSGPIPSELGKLGALQYLALGDNKLSGPIPSELGKLGALQYLALGGNKLSGPIPEALGDLSKLQMLSLSSNQLTGMGTGDHADALLPVLLNCREVHLWRNPWELPPASVVVAGKDAIRGYYDELKVSKTGPTKMQSLKVVFAGHSGAGKTSLIKTILKGRGELAQGDDLETVGVKVSDYVSKQGSGRTVKFYDLAGQSDYYGLHQLFLTEKAVYVMTWDASKFMRRKEALVEELMGWITALHMRAPHCTVILVGTHSDQIAGGWWTKLLLRLNLVPSLSSVMADVEATLKTKHEAWKVRRGASTDQGLKVESGVILVSSSPGAGNSNVSELLKRFDCQEGTTLFIPPSWSLALMVLDALKYGLKPLYALTRWEKDQPLPIEGTKRAWIEKSKIIAAWQEVQNALPPDRKVGDPSFAMESALNLREFGGSLLRHEEVVFLDIEQFALRLAPILDHKVCEQDEDGVRMFGGKRLVDQWQQEASRHLIDRGILHRCFACFLWDEHGKHFPEATFDVLVKLGILLPLGSDYDRWEATPRIATGDHNCGRIHARNANTACGRGYLVLMRLPGEAPPGVVSRLETFAGLTQEWGLVSRWEFHNGSAPHGLVERIIASCHIIGDVVGGTCWRKGACFVGNDAGSRAGGGSYALTVDFCKNTGENVRTAGTLTVRAFGARDGKAVWGAMRFAISTVLRLLHHFPGLSWEAWFECPEHAGVPLYSLPGPRDNRHLSPGEPIVASCSMASCPLCSVTTGLSGRLGHVLFPFPSMDEIFRCPAETDGGIGTISDAERAEAAARGAKFAEALDNVKRAMVVDDEPGHEVPPARRRLLEWGVPIGGALALVGLFWEPILVMADRWADGDSLSKALPITLLLALVLVMVIRQLAATWCSPLRRLRRWLSSRTHLD